MEHLSTLHAIKRHARPIGAGLLLGLTLIWAENALANPAQPPDFLEQSIAAEGEACTRAIARAERRNGIPRGLLAAISLAESGRWDDANKANVAWPWTVTTGGEGHFLPSRVDAVAYVEALQADGVQNIDVGCMQINLKYHPDAFADITDAFDPATNVAYAATFLKERFTVTKSWMRAAGQYHSSTPERGRAYRAKITRLWRGGEAADTRVGGATNVTQPDGGAAVAQRIVATPQTPDQATRLAAARPDRELTRKLNARFQATRAGAQGAPMSPEARVIANRVRALKPGAFADDAATRAERFREKRQNQLQAWRARNGLAPPAPAPAH